MEWRSASGVLSDCRIPIKLMKFFYKTAMQLAMFYGTECWAIKNQHIPKN